MMDDMGIALEKVIFSAEDTVKAFSCLSAAFNEITVSMRVFGDVIGPYLERRERLRWQLKMKGRRGWKRVSAPRG